MSKRSYGFSLNIVLTKLAMIVVVWSVMRLVILYGDHRDTKVLNNYIRLYDLTIDVWNTHASLQSTILSIVTSGTNQSVLEADPESNLKNKQKRLSQVLVPSLKSFGEENLGEFSQYYNDITSNLLLCDRLNNKDLQYYDNCGKGALTFINGNIVATIQ